VAGYSSVDSERFAVVRYLSDGTLDPAFGAGGVVTFQFNGLRSKGEAIAIQPDGKILISGGIQSNANFGVARLNPDGSLDATFGTGGRVSTSFSAFTDYAKAIALQADGKIVVGGYTQAAVFTLQSNFAICRYQPDGTLDADFGVGGKKTVVVGTQAEEIRSLIVLADGRILATGLATAGSIGSYVKGSGMARFLANGDLDPAFGNAGISYSGWWNGGESFGAGLQSDGRIVVVGQQPHSAGGTDFVTKRHSIEGYPSPFGPGAYSEYLGVTTSIAGGEDIPVGMAVAPDGKIFVAGRFRRTPENLFSPQDEDFAVVRLTAAGVPDPKFSGDGRLTTSIASGASTDRALAMVLQPDGKLIVAGSASDGTTTTGALVRYLANGNLDTTFGGTGKVLPAGSALGAVALQKDGKIITAGSVRVVVSNLNTSDIRISRHLPNGSLDRTFDGDGIAQISFDEFNTETIRRILVQPDGRILLAGDSASQMLLARLNTNGSLDPTFGSNGRLITTLGGNRYSSARAIALQSDGRIVVAGVTGDTGTVVRSGLARFASDGSADPTFGIGGRVTTVISSTGSGFNDVQIQADGKLVAGGWAGMPDNRGFALARYRTDGSLDTGFNGTGWIAVAPGPGISEVFGIGLQANGAIITAGQVLGEYDYDFLITRVEGGPEISVEQPAGTEIPNGGSLGFGTVVANQGKSMNLIVRNLGSSVFILSNPVIFGTTPGEFTITRFQSSVLAPGEGASLAVTFRPAGSGDRSAMIRLASDDDDESDYRITVTGVSNLPPVFTDYAANTGFQSSMTLGRAKLLARASDPEGDPVSFVGVDPVSVRGGAVLLSASGIVYTPPPGFSGPDSFRLNISDSRGGVSTGTVLVTVAPDPARGGANSNPPRITLLPDGSIRVGFQGISGHTYRIQRSADLESWTTITTIIAGPPGVLEHDDGNPLQPTGFYRLISP
jgi:uncharacterized delta-60 repeat protein